MGEIIQLMNYATYKEELRQELQKQADSFVRTGYLLRLAMDTDILKESGYYNVNEFAKAEFNIDASTVSRYININMRFSENGYSERIAEQYQGIGYAKLSLMLLLPDAINEELTAAFSKTEVQAIKEEYNEEKQITDLEVLMEGEDAKQMELESILAKALHQLGMDEPELFLKLFEVYKTHSEHYLAAGFKDMLTPQGENIYSVRPKGVGRLMISVKENSDEVAIINVRSGEKELHSWDEVVAVLGYFMYDRGTEGKEAWQQLYGMPFPEKEQKKAEIAPVQQNKEQKNKKAEPRKQSKVTKAKKPASPEPEKVPEVEDQIPGQDSVLNHPEYLPDNMKTEQEKTDAEEQENTEQRESLQKTPNVPDSDETEHGEDAEGNVADGTDQNETPEPLQNVTEDSEIVQELPGNTDFTKSESDSDSPAAGIGEANEDFEKIWDRAEAAEMKLCMFFDEYDDEEARNTEEFKDELRTAYQTAVSVAADLERMLNVEKYHA